MMKDTKAMFTSGRDDWRTPTAMFDALNKEFFFNVDLCADENNHLCAEYYTKDRDGLNADLRGKRVFCNPPYGKTLGKWVRKCAESKAEVAVMLIPARTDTAWFHDYVWGKAEVRFIRRRIRFDGSTTDAPFPSMIVIFKEDSDER